MGRHWFQWGKEGQPSTAFASIGFAWLDGLHAVRLWSSIGKDKPADDTICGDLTAATVAKGGTDSTTVAVVAVTRFF